MSSLTSVIDKEIPLSISEAFPTDGPPLAMNLHCRDGRIHSFPYGHLLHFVHETNPDAEYQPSAPPERLSLLFSTHDVVILGRNLKSAVDLICRGRLASVRALETRYQGLLKHLPFVTEILVRQPRRDS